MAQFPLARIEPNKALPLAEGLNPAWVEAIQTFRAQVVKPLLGEKTLLTEEEWQRINAKWSAYESWLGDKGGSLVEKLGLKRVRALLASNVQAALTKLIAKDKTLEPQANSIGAVDRLVRYHRDLYPLLNNFVSFTAFYSRQQKAIFQAGTLYLDGRSCELCVRVGDMAKHGTLATLSRTYLACCDCTRKASAEKMTIAAALTNGDSDNLMVGRNGLFYDRQGRDWDATIVKIIEHPISLRQAFWMPYKKMGKWVSDQIEKMAAAREKAVQDTASAKVADMAKTAEAGKASTPAAFDVAKFAGIFAAIGLAIGAIGGAIGAMLTAFTKLAWWQMPLALLGIVLVISGPSVIMAWLKLRQRNLGPILDANGWAVNGRVKINIPFGAALTSIPLLPANSKRSLEDPYAQKSHTGLWITLIVIVLAAAVAGYIYWPTLKQTFSPKPAPKPAMEAPAK